MTIKNTEIVSLRNMIDGNWVKSIVGNENIMVLRLQIKTQNAAWYNDKCIWSYYVLSTRLMFDIQTNI